MTVCNKIIRRALVGATIIALGFNVPMHAVIGLKGVSRQRLLSKQLAAPASRRNPSVAQNAQGNPAPSAWQNMTSILKGAAHSAAQTTANLGSRAGKGLMAATVIGSSIVVPGMLAADYAVTGGNEMAVDFPEKNQEGTLVLAQALNNQCAYSACTKSVPVQEVQVQEINRDGTFTNLERVIGKKQKQKKYDTSWRTNSSSYNTLLKLDIRGNRVQGNAAGAVYPVIQATAQPAQKLQKLSASPKNINSKNTQNSGGTGSNTWVLGTIAGITGVGMATNAQKKKESKKEESMKKKVVQVAVQSVTQNTSASVSQGVSPISVSSSVNSSVSSPRAYEAAGEPVHSAAALPASNTGYDEKEGEEKVESEQGGPSLMQDRQTRRPSIPQLPSISQLPVQDSVHAPEQVVDQEVNTCPEEPASTRWPTLQNVKDGALVVAEGACTGAWRLASGFTQAVGLGVKRALPVNDERITEAVVGQTGLNMEMLRRFFESKMSEKLEEMGEKVGNVVKGEVKDEIKETCKQVAVTEGAKIGDKVREKIDESYAGLAAKAQDPDGRKEMADLVEESTKNVLAAQMNIFFEKTKMFFAASTAAMASCAALAVQKGMQEFMGGSGESDRDNQEQNNFDVDNFVGHYLNNNGSNNSDSRGDAPVYTAPDSRMQYAPGSSRAYAPASSRVLAQRRSRKTQGELSSQDWEDIKHEASLTGAPTRDKLKAIARRIVGERRLAGW